VSITSALALASSWGWPAVAVEPANAEFVPAIAPARPQAMSSAARVGGPATRVRPRSRRRPSFSLAANDGGSGIEPVKTDGPAAARAGEDINTTATRNSFLARAGRCFPSEVSSSSTGLGFLRRHVVTGPELLNSDRHAAHGAGEGHHKNPVAVPPPRAGR